MLVWILISSCVQIDVEGCDVEDKVHNGIRKASKVSRMLKPKITQTHSSKPKITFSYVSITYEKSCRQEERDQHIAKRYESGGVEKIGLILTLLLHL